MTETILRPNKLSIDNDRGGEYEAMKFFCKENEIRHLFAMPYKPQQNSIAER
jgi:transposase InsO family protein